MEQSDLLVRRIKDGTVIDHINEGKGLNVLEALEIDGSSGNVITIALNMPSGKLKKKDMIKVEGRFLEGGDTNKLAVIAPSSTVNIIKDYKLVEKRRVSLPPGECRGVPASRRVRGSHGAERTSRRDDSATELWSCAPLRRHGGRLLS